MRRYAEAAGGFGEAFLAYLELDLPEPAEGEAKDFLERYLGFYPDRETFIRERLTNLGWTAALSRTLVENGIWPQDVRWNGFALWEHFSRMYGLVERFGGVHAFRR